MNQMINFIKATSLMEIFDMDVKENGTIRLTPKVDGFNVKDFLIKKDTRINVATDWMITNDETIEWTAVYCTEDILPYIGFHL